MRFCTASVDSLIIYFGDDISQKVAKKVQDAYLKLRPHKGDLIQELIPSYTSILVQFDILKMDFESLKGKIEKILKQDLPNQARQTSRLIEIPVYYHEEVGLDLEDVALFHKISIKDLIKIHSQKEYLVYAIGFLPGFAYMGEVDKSIQTPRIANPRQSIPKGSVGIADKQTAIYPQKSPGGWRILGRTPLDMFDFSIENYSFLKVGDKVKYKPINKKEFLDLGGVL